MAAMPPPPPKPTQAKVTLVPDDIEGRPANMEVAYRGSTHFRFWIFTPEQLRTIKETTHARALSRFPHLQSVPSPGGPGRPDGGAGTGAGAGAGAGAQRAAPGTPPRPSSTAVPSTPSSLPDVEMVSPSPAQKRKVPRSDDGDVVMTAPTPAKKARKGQAVQPLSVEEEDRLKRFWELEIRRVCEELRFSYYITATATMYLKRFYLFKTVMDIKPQDIMTCAIFLAIKAEASPFGEVEQLVRQLTDLLELEDKDLLQHEMLLLMGNRFHVTVYHPYRALRCLVRKFKLFVSKTVGETRGDTLASNMYERALELVHQAVATDCPLLYHPGQIANAAMMLAGDDAVAVPKGSGPLHLRDANIDLDAFLHDALGEQCEEADKAYQLEAAKQAGKLILNALASPQSQEDASKLEKRRKKCSNPAYIPGTTEYKARMAKREADLAARKAAKQRAKRQAAEAKQGGAQR